MQQGCNIGYHGPRLHRITKNLPSALGNPSAVSDALAKECSRGHMAGPFTTLPHPFLQCSPLGVVPKKDGTWRLIMDLSSPHGSSINDHISKEEFTLHYTSFDTALKMVARHGRGSLMAKVHIKHAFRLCPVHRKDWELLGLYWQNNYFVDLRLPFGLHSSPHLFNRLADALEWILLHNYGVSDLLHYLDDYFTAGPASSARCAINLASIQNTCHRLGVPLAPEKVVGPTTSICFLGLQIDSLTMEVSLPQDKYQDLYSALLSWSNRKKCQKRELLSLIGKLNFACNVVPTGRTFLRRLIDLSTQVSKLHHFLSPNLEARRDLTWWIEFLPSWNGRSLIPDPAWTTTPSMELFTDASVGLGFRIYYCGSCIANPWPPSLQAHSIQWKELYPIALACVTWGHTWTRKRILFHCDNLAVGHIWQSGTSRVPAIMHLMRSIVLHAATHQYTINVTHISGIDNSIADSLSRQQLTRFRNLAPAANLHPTSTPVEAKTLWWPV